RAHRAALAPGVNPKTNRGRSTATNSPHRSRAWARYRTSLRRVRIDHCEEPEDDRANERGRLGNASVPRRVLSDLGHREKHERLLTGHRGLPASSLRVSSVSDDLHYGSHRIRITVNYTLL